ncbi:hypothetical protein M9H77_34703 [Catharanthus roseus]|uniref:Uncharacterized protein n=1 Tax=Catharanthus roseus TaxID=4058 RepID=A0ACB9ZNT7_CATRO|nr:hypothetical protein M9H77_34703 [Catharanthus roseus]
MEKVPTHVHPGPIVTDVLSKQYEHKSGLIWSGDRETCYTDLQCRRFGRNLFRCYSVAPRRLVEIIDRTGLGGVFSHFSGYKVKKEPLKAWILRAFTGSETDNDLILRVRHIAGVVAFLGFCIDSCTRRLWEVHDRLEGSLVLNQWRVHVRDGPAVAVEALSYPSDENIRWYRGITRVYIDNPANRDTCAHGYQPASTSMLQEVDDMASVAIREPPSSPSQIAAVMKKVQTIIRRCMVSIGDRGARGVKRGARRHLGRGAGAGRPPIPPAPQRQEHVDPGPAVIERDPQSLPIGFGTSQMPPVPNSGFVAFQSPHPSAYGFPGFRAPPPLGTAGSSTPHQPISQASSSDKEEGQDALSRGHRVGKKIVRFTPSDWP